MRSPFLSSLSAIAVVLGACGGVRASVDFTLSAAPDPAYFTISGPSATILDVGQTGATTLDAGPLIAQPGIGALQADLAGLTLEYAEPSLTSNLQDTEHVSFTFGYDVTVNDLDTSVSKTILVTGKISGKVSSTDSALKITDFRATPSTLDLGGDHFTITASLSPTTGRPDPGTAPLVWGPSGSLLLHIADPPASGVAAVPEPASFALLGLGGAIALKLLRRRKPAAA